MMLPSLALAVEKSPRNSPESGKEIHFMSSSSTEMSTAPTIAFLTDVRLVGASSRHESTNISSLSDLPQNPSKPLFP